MLLLSLFCILSCQKERESASDARGRLVTITASVKDDNAPDTRTRLDAEGKFMWSPSEEINVIYGSGSGSKFTSVNTEPAAITDFQGNIEVVTGQEGEAAGIKFWGIYPYDSGNSVISRNESTFADVVFPNYQQSGENTWGEKQFLYIGQSDGLAMGFHNACSGFKFYLERDDIREIHFSLDDGSPVAGRVNVEMTTGVPVITGFGEPSYKEIILVPENGGTFKKSVEGRIIWYYMAIPPGTYGPRTFTFITDNEVGVRKFSSVQTARRNVFVTWEWPGKALDRTDNNSSGVPFTKFSPVSVYSNQITYTASSGPASIPDHASCCPDGYSYNPVVRHDYDPVTKKGAITYRYPLKYVEEHFMTGNAAVTSVQLPDGVEIIGERAFESCSALVGIHLGSGLKEIGPMAFRYCNSLERITFPSGFPGSGLPVSASSDGLAPSNPFWYCPSLESFTCPDGFVAGRSGVMTSDDGRCLIAYDAAGTTTLYAFAPAGVGHYALPDGINAIANFAFSGCEGLEYVEFPYRAGLDRTYGAPFGNNRIETFLIRIPSSLDYKKMADYSSWWGDLSSYYGTRVEIRQGVNEVWWHFPEGQEVEGVMPGITPYLDIADQPLALPAGLTLSPLVPFPWETLAGTVYCGFTGTNPIVSKNGFASLTQVDYVSLPAKVTRINEGAFASCTKLRVFPLGENNILSVIGPGAFSKCQNITKIDLPSITTVGNMAFADMPGLTQLRFGENLNTIGDAIFLFSALRDFRNSSNKLDIWFTGPFPSSVSKTAFVGYVISGGGNYLIDPHMVYVNIKYRSAYAEGFEKYWGTLTSDDVTFIRVIR